jgi:hypothetical protein
MTPLGFLFRIFLGLGAFVIVIIALACLQHCLERRYTR